MPASQQHFNHFSKSASSYFLGRRCALITRSIGFRVCVVVASCALSHESLKAVYEENEYEVAGFLAPAGLISFTVKAWKETEDGGGSGISPSNPVSESGFVRLYSNGRLVGNQSIPFLIQPGQVIQNVTVSGLVTAGPVSVRFINGYMQLNPGGAPALPQRTFIVYFVDNVTEIPPTPSPTPTPIFDFNTAPTVRWTAPVEASDEGDTSWEVSTLRPFAIAAQGTDIDGSPATRLVVVNLSGPKTQPPGLTFPMAFRQASGTPPPYSVNTADTTLEIYSEADGVRYPGIRYPGVYTFTAQAFDASGRTSREITMTITATDNPAPAPQSIQAMIVSGASHPGDVFTLGGADTARAELRGGIFTLGTRAALSGTGTGPLTFTPDDEYLTGQKVPLFIPWLYDVREVNYRILARTSSGVVTTMRRASGAEAQRMLANPNQTPYPARTPGGGKMMPPAVQRPLAPVPTPTPVPTPKR